MELPPIESLKSLLNESSLIQQPTLQDKILFQTKLHNLFLEIQNPFLDFVLKFNESAKSNEEFQFDWDMIHQSVECWNEWTLITLKYLSEADDIDTNDLQTLKLYEKINRIQQIRLNDFLNLNLINYLIKLAENNSLLFNIILTNNNIKIGLNSQSVTSMDYTQMLLVFIFGFESCVNLQTCKALNFHYQKERQNKSYLSCQNHLDQFNIKQELHDIGFSEPFSKKFLDLIPEQLRQLYIPNVIYKFILDINCKSSDPAKNFLWLANYLLQCSPNKTLSLYLIQMIHAGKSDTQQDESHKLFAKLDLVLLIRSNQQDTNFNQSIIDVFLTLTSVIITLNHSQQITYTTSNSPDIGHELLYSLIYVMKSLPHCFYGVLRHGLDLFSLEFIEDKITPYITKDSIGFSIPSIKDSHTGNILLKALGDPSSFYYSNLEGSKYINIVIRDAYWFIYLLDRLIQSIQNIYKQFDKMSNDLQDKLKQYNNHLLEVSYELVRNISKQVQTNYISKSHRPSVDQTFDPVSSYEQLATIHNHIQTLLFQTKSEIDSNRQDLTPSRIGLFEALLNLAHRLEAPSFFGQFTNDISIPNYLHHPLGHTLYNPLLDMIIEPNIHNISYPIEKTQLILARWPNQFQQLDSTLQSQALETLTFLFASRRFPLEFNYFFDCGILLNYINSLDLDIRHHGVILALLFLKFQKNTPLVSLKRIAKFAFECLFESFHQRIQSDQNYDINILLHSTKQLFYALSQKGCNEHMASLFVDHLFSHIESQNSITNLPSTEPMTVSLLQANREFVASDRGPGAMHTDLPRFKKNYRNQLKETASSCYFPQFPNPTDEQLANLNDLQIVLLMFNHSPVIYSIFIRYLAIQYQCTPFGKGDFDLFKKKYSIIPLAIPEWELLNKFVSHPYLIELLLLSTAHKVLWVKISKTFLTLLISLSAFWTSKGRFEGQNAKKSKTKDFPVYLYLTQKLLLCLSQSNLITTPLNYVYHMVSELTCAEMGQILNKSIWSYIQFTNANNIDLEFSDQFEFTLPSKQKLKNMKNFLRPIQDIIRLRLSELSPFFPLFFTCYGKVFENLNDWI